MEHDSENSNAKASRWTRRSQAVVYDNPWIRVEHHEVTAPTGVDTIYGLVHMHNTAVGIIPLDEDNHIWLVGQLRYPLDAWSWEVPMGGVKTAGLEQTADEQQRRLLDGAARELTEETGLSAERYTELVRLHTSNCVTDEVGVVYLAEGLTHAAPTPDPTEQLTVKRLPFVEAWTMAMNGSMSDALSVAAILKLGILRPHLLGS
ncbi:NUDIX hydrolase [Allohahella marinimesophila]|uniref:GDP-mannose pyrophosphatase n=1 Tax=Allohahella marinimesophila TaxID=1054972 RepID=A0ABP7NPC2_9GAMM